MSESIHHSCFLCNGSDINILKGYERHGLLKCSNCGFVFMQKIPSHKELENYYFVFDYEEERELTIATKLSLENRLDSFEKYRENNRMLDVGCGEGWMLELAKQRGWQVYGTEFSTRAIEICLKKGIKMYPGVLNPESIEEKVFDVIISSETIEHINNPREEVMHIHQLLRKGGLFCVTTPNFNSYLRIMLRDKYDIIRYPGHLSYYTKKTLNKLLEQSGFEKIKLQTTGISISHFQISIGKKDTFHKMHISSDERLRSKIVNSAFLRGVKKIINAGLTFLGIGMTIKAYYIKK